MTKNTKHLTIKNKIILIGIGLGVSYWFLETVMHVFAFQEGHFIEQILPSDPDELWMRSLVVCLFIAFSIYAGSTVGRLMRAEKVLQESEDKYKTLTENSLTGVFINQDNKYVFINDRFAEIHGYKAKELLGKEYSALIHPDERRKVAEIRSKRLKGKEVLQRYEVRRLKKDDQTIWCEMMASRIDYMAKPAIMGNIIDISVRKKAEEALQAANQQLEAANQQLRATEQQLKAANQQLRADEQQLKAANQQLRASEQQLKAANQQLRASEQQLKAANQQLEAANQQLRASQKELQESEVKYRALFDNMLDGFAYCKILLDKNNHPMDFVYLDVNNAFEKLTGLKKQNVIGKKVTEVIPGVKDSHPELFDIYGKVALTGKETQFDIYFKPLEIWLSISAYSPQKGYFAAVFENITERKKAEEKLLDDRRQLKQLASQLTLAEERERRQIATELHAAIAQSLVVSKLQLDTLRASVPSADIAKTLDEVCSSLDQTIQNTRTLTFDLSSPILYELGFETAVAEWLTERIQQKHSIATEFEDDGQTKPLDDDVRALLFRDVRELLINVVKHAKARKVKVSVRKAGSEIHVSVEDDGCGFNSREIAAVAAKKGGFGLFSIRERLEQLAGRLDIDSAPGQGTRVTVIAPLKTQAD